MGDIFIEHLVTRGRDIKARLLSMAYITALLFVITVTFVVPILSFLIPAAVIGGIWLVIILIRHLDIEFEYIITNGELDVDRISGKRRRKRLLTVDSRNFEIIAPDNESNFSPYAKAEFKQTIDASSNANPRWFAVGPSKMGGKLLLYFEPNEKMLDAFKKYNSRALRS
ncbi:MAG: DUF6106 family protein [Oscillospiraceae bacterium]|nr:DUF6106 family protein [Oscillospiraceae bacterium]